MQVFQALFLLKKIEKLSGLGAYRPVVCYKPPMYLQP